ncbi:unnamed protein product [Microthlaspi erraticum]|uniref:CW-type domain-containing protein n=1 Tax=Microthlaspi erraticum TaxID=1685480 RepID=A0A6D2L9B1_9BRAS|nr:unnamed protein product [Microthlaspi erraticum]
MGESSELEEGEMDCSTGEAVVDLDVDLSYIDKKVQSVLGHFQKDYEVGSPGMVGPDIYQYGSFLPTYKREPAVPPCQRGSFGNHAVQGFANNVPEKNVVQKFQSMPATSCNLVSKQGPQNCQTSGSLLAQAPVKVPIMKAIASIPGNGLSEHKPIRVRIKMGSEILSRKVTMVCKDLGLTDSPNSTSRTSHGDDGSRMLPRTSLEKTSESPSCILREMTAILIPEDLLMSPLPDSLLLVKDKEKQYTLLDKAGEEPSSKSQNKFSDVLSSGGTPSGKRRKAVDCFDATTRNGVMKKQRIFPTGQLARESLACGLGGKSSADGFTKKSNLQKGRKRDGESGPLVASAISSKMKVVGKHAEKEKNPYPTKLKQNSSSIDFGDKMLPKTPFKDATYIGQNSMDIGLDLAVAPSSTSLDLDNWAQCDSCETWRLLPFGMKTEQLPEKWLCSMQTWLPEMNHCAISEEETINAIKSYHGGTQAHGPETGVTFLSDASNADKSYQPLTSGSFPNPIEKKSTVKDLSRNGLVDAAKPMRKNPHMIKIKNIKLPLEPLNASQISTDLGVPQDFDQKKIDQKAKWRTAGSGNQIMIKKKTEGDHQASEGSKQIKTGDGNKLFRDIKAEEIHWKQDQDWTPADRKIKRHDNDFCTSDVERDSKKRLLTSRKKPDHKPQLTNASGSLCTKAKKIRLVGNNGNNSKLSADGEEKLTSMEFKADQRNELFQSKQNADASCRFFSGGSGQVSGVETSSSSKVLGSHKSVRRCVEEAKASPVESVSSSPARSSCPKSLALAGERISRQNQNLNRIPLSQEADCESTHPGNRNQPKPEICKQNSKFGDLRCTSIKKDLENRAGIENFSSISHETMDRSSQGANVILQEAEQLRTYAECLKNSKFDYKEAHFIAALKYLLGASLLEMQSTEKVEGEKMRHVEAYHTAAKLSESCASQYEINQEMAAAALAYKCMEVACMRLVYGKTLGQQSGEWNELQKIVVQITPLGESPSSSASDVDSFNHQGVIDKSAKTKRGLSHVAGNILPVAITQLNFVPLLDFTENMNLAMEASAKSQNAFRAMAVTSEETQDEELVSAIKKVVDFSFHDVEALVRMIQLAMKVLS